jgi:transcriptional regulator with XRE-family HTH domain
MTAFTARQVLSEYKGIGDQLRSSRMERNWNVVEVARKLGSQPQYIEALEEEDYRSMPKGIYGQILLKKYSSLLGLDYRKISKNFLRERKIFQSQDDDVFSKKVVKRRGLMVFPKLFRDGLIILAIVACALYLGLYLKKITAPPDLAIISPADNAVLSDYNITIIGVTTPESEVTINGQAILADKSGDFQQAVTLKSGVNIIVVKAKKKYGRENTVTRQILVEKKYDN